MQIRQLLLLVTCLSMIIIGLLPASGQQELFRSVLTDANLDLDNTTEFPKNIDGKGGFGNANSRNDGLLGALHVRGVLAPHASWQTGETDQRQRYLRISFKELVPIGTLIGGGGEVSYLKMDAMAPGDVMDDTQWVKVLAPDGQAGLTVTPFPPGVLTRALRFSFNDKLPNGGASRSGFGGLVVLKARLDNLTPEALAFASSQVTGSANVVEQTRVQNLVSGGNWRGAPKQDISPDHPEWVILSWPKAKAFSGIGFVNAFAKRLEVDMLKPEETAHPAVAPETSWVHIAGLNWPIWWRPAYTDAYLPFNDLVTTRALRVRITEPLTKENADIAGSSGGGKRTVSLSGIMTFTDLGVLPTPSRLKVVAELPPIKIPLTMPYNGNLTIAIDDTNGKRVRNLVGDEERKFGPLQEAWDGRDDAGNLLPAGRYTWKAITHQPLHYTYQSTVNNSGNPPWWKSGSWGDQSGPGSWLSDHAAPNDVTVIGDKVFIGAVIAESGHTILACDLDGKKLWGTKWLETAGAGFLTNDGQKVYSVGEGGWIGERLMIHEIDPITFKWRRATQLVFDTGNTPTGGVSGLAARDGKLYIAFNHAPLSWTRSAIATQNIDTVNTTAFGNNLTGMLRTKNDVPSGWAWSTTKSADPVQYLRLAFLTPQPIGSFISPKEMEMSVLKPEAAYPGDLTNDDQWIAMQAGQQQGLRVYTAPESTISRAIRFTFRKPKVDGQPWNADLSGGLLLAHRFQNALAGAKITASSGVVKADGSWSTVQQTPITIENPATLTITWPEARTFRGLGFLNFFAKRAEISMLKKADADPATALETDWTVLGDISPAVRWRPAYSDDYFDAGKDITTRAIRLRVLEPLVSENTDIANDTKGKLMTAGIGGLIVLKALGNDPQTAELPPQRISVVNIANGKWEQNISVPEPRFPHFDADGNLVVVSGKQVVRVSLPDGKITPVIATGLDDPRGITFDAAKNIYVADGKTEQVKVFSPDGKLLRTIASPGGRMLGAYDKTHIENPQGIAIDPRGKLWVTESDHQPKRTSLWSADGKFLNEFIGPAQYGAGGFLDPQDKSRFYYNGMEFAIDWATGGWKIKNILTRNQPALSEGNTDHPVYIDNKQYMVNDPSGMGSKLLLVGEIRKDRVAPMVVLGNAEMWKPFSDVPALRKLVSGKPLSAYSFIWTDANGDGIPQADEVTLSPEGVRLNSTYWPTIVNKKLEVQMGNRLLKPTAYTAAGVPIYKPFGVKPIPAFPVENIYSTAVDSMGRVLINGRPVTAYHEDGTVDWTYPQKWVGVHDSQVAPLHKPGQMIGALGFIGQEDVPGIGETFMLNGNKGEWYLFTDDGLLAATIWQDYRNPGAISWNFPEAKRGLSLDGLTIGEEHFGGGFVRTKDGKFYLIAGHNHNSIVELLGLESMKRQQGSMAVTPQDMIAAEQWNMRQAIRNAQVEAPKFIRASTIATPIKPDGDLTEWKDDSFNPIGTRGTAAISSDAKNLYLAYRVDSNLALRNNGDDWKMLFKTGDSVDLQIAVNPKANPVRTTPVPGDQRLLITLFEGKPIGVLYQHRVLNTPQAEKNPFASPIRTEYVDKILKLDVANIGIARTAKGYAVEAIVPLALLGLTPQKGTTYKIDFGILSADNSGNGTLVRTYWANQATGIVSDVPSEIMLTPGLWGDITFE